MASVVTMVASFATGTAAVVALLLTYQSLTVTERGQVSDRFGRAVEQLGAKTLDVRLGGIYALEQLMRDSPKDQPTVIEVLSAYVRTHAPAPTKTPVDRPARLATDVQAALTVLGRRNPDHDGDPELNRHTGHIDLTRTDLRGADFADANLFRANLYRANLYRANFTDANLFRADLTGADLTGANLYRADLFRADLTGADLFRADLTGADLFRADLTGANLTGANLTGANLTGADLAVTDLAGASLAAANLIDASLANANLTGADLTGADLTGANLTDANLTCVHVNGDTKPPNMVRVPPPPKEGCPQW